MKRKGVASHSSLADGKDVEEIVPNQLEAASLGDMIWVESRGNSWWPAQVVDENIVSKCVKPDTRLEGQILVRLYGCYTYAYTDPVKSRSEFDIVLKQNNGCYRKIFQHALEQDRLQVKSGKSKAQGSTSKDMTIGAKRHRKPNRNKEKKSVELGSPSKISGAAKVWTAKATKANMEGGKSSSKNSSGRGTQRSAKKLKSLDDEFSARTSPRRKSNAKQNTATSAEARNEKNPAEDKALDIHD